MKLTFYILPSGTEQHAFALIDAYTKKISRFVAIDLVKLKPKKIEGDRSAEKRSQESLLLVQQLEKHQRNILFDEAGRTFACSKDFSNRFVKQLSSNNVAFYIGGAFGMDESLKPKFSEVWSLSPLTTNHHLAGVLALEQIYRALTIWKNHPYHND